jgi:TetR/AcrR family transcriptional regulator, cholesterol catabolism regulator
VAVSDSAPEASSSRLERRRAQANLISNEEYSKRRQDILRSAAEVMREKGLQATTLKDIAAAVGGDRASIYYYFRNKEDIFREMIRLGMSDVINQLQVQSRVETAPSQRLRAAIEVVLTAYETHYPYLYLYFQEDHSSRVIDPTLNAEILDLGRKYETLFRQIVDDGVRAGEFTDKIPTTVVLYSVMGMINWTHRWFRPGGGMSAVQLSSFMSDLLLRGLEPMPLS